MHSRCTQVSERPLASSGGTVRKITSRTNHPESIHTNERIPEETLENRNSHSLTYFSIGRLPPPPRAGPRSPLQQTRERARAGKWPVVVRLRASPTYIPLSSRALMPHGFCVSFGSVSFFCGGRNATLDAGHTPLLSSPRLLLVQFACGLDRYVHT